ITHQMPTMTSKAPREAATPTWSGPWGRKDRRGGLGGGGKTQPQPGQTRALIAASPRHCGQLFHGPPDPPGPMGSAPAVVRAFWGTTGTTAAGGGEVDGGAA